MSRAAIPPRQRTFAVPPPDPAEALYYEGMAAYQHRNWEQALERFGRLKELQPTRPGLDALLDEVRWFLQLQANTPNTPWSPPGLPVPDGEGVSLPALRSRWQTWGLVALATIGIVALVLIALQWRLPWTNAADREVQELYNRGQARLAVGDYEGAQAAFQRLVEIAPNNPEAALGLERAKRQQTLAQSYAAAEAAIAEQDWDAAAEKLAAILALDSRYADAQTKADFVAQRQRLAQLYTDGSRLYDLGRWEDAIAQFEKIRELDASYRTEAVAEFLFVCYLNAGQILIEGPDGTVQTAQQAIGYFSSALIIHPRNRSAADARRLGGIYLDATRALAASNLAEAQARLEVLLAESPSYANGRAALQLYDLLIRQAQEAIRSGNQQAAISFYQQAQAVPVSDHTVASEGEAYARTITPTPTPRPAATPTPQRTPVPATPSVQPPSGTPYAVVRTGVLNLRAGPSTAYPVLGQVRSDSALAITGRNADSTWFRVCCVADQEGWVMAALVEAQGAVAAVAIVTPEPLPTPTPTPPGQLICLAGRVLDAGGTKPLAGWTIVLQTSGTETQTARSDSLGAYRFLGLRAGTFTVGEVLESGWRAVSPQSTTVVLVPANSCAVVDFWNAREEGSVSPPATSQPTSQPTPPR